MTKSGLPAITITCRNGHGFTTRAHGRVTVRCPECGVSKRVPVGRPTTALEVREAERVARRLAELERQDQAAELGQLADRWERITPWSGDLVALPGRPADECAECGGPLCWEPGRTVTHCPECRALRLPAAVAEHYARQDQRSAEVAVRAAPDASADRAARVRLRALQQRMADRVNDWIDELEPEGLTGGPLRLALDYRAELAAYLPEIRNADSPAELADIMAEITEITDRAAGAMAEIAQQREAAGIAADRAEQAQREAREAEQAELEAARLAERESARLAELEARAQRKAIEGPARPRPVGVDPAQSPYLVAAVSVAGLIRNRRKEPGSWLQPR